MFYIPLSEADTPLIHIPGSKQVVFILSQIVSALPKLPVRRDHCEDVHRVLAYRETREVKLPDFLQLQRNPGWKLCPNLRLVKRFHYCAKGLGLGLGGVAYPSLEQ